MDETYITIPAENVKTLRSGSLITAIDPETGKIQEFLTVNEVMIVAQEDILSLSTGNDSPEMTA